MLAFIVTSTCCRTHNIELSIKICTGLPIAHLWQHPGVSQNLYRPTYCTPVTTSRCQSKSVPAYLLHTCDNIQVSIKICTGLPIAHLSQHPGVPAYLLHTCDNIQVSIKICTGLPIAHLWQYPGVNQNLYRPTYCTPVTISMCQSKSVQAYLLHTCDNIQVSIKIRTGLPIAQLWQYPGVPAYLLHTCDNIQVSIKICTGLPIAHLWQHSVAYLLQPQDLCYIK